MFWLLYIPPASYWFRPVRKTSVKLCPTRLPALCLLLPSTQNLAGEDDAMLDTDFRLIVYMPPKRKDPD